LRIDAHVRRLTQINYGASKELLQHKVSVLCELEEIVFLLERSDASVIEYFREKIHAAIAEKRPLHRPVIS